MIERKLSLYIHYPYCQRLCNFCNFNKYTLGSRDPDHLAEAYKLETATKLRRFREHSSLREVHSIYFGGGTPSLAPSLVRSILDEVDMQGFRITRDCEITLEANVSSLPLIGNLQELGVTRLSLGAQSLCDDGLLKYFNRDHTTTDAQRALGTICENVDKLRHGFSFDLMFGNPKLLGSTVMIEDELRAALPFAEIGGHLSIYELTIKIGTPLARDVRAGEVLLPSPDEKAEQYDKIIDFMHEYDLAHYEVSSFAKKGCMSKHNVAFWLGNDLIAIGPGAHGRETVRGGSFRTRNIAAPKIWQEAVQARGSGEILRSKIQMWPQELISLGLRTSFGVLRTAFSDFTGKPMMDVLERDAVRNCIRLGLLEELGAEVLRTKLTPEYHSSASTGALRATRKGRAVLDLLLPEILAPD